MTSDAHSSPQGEPSAEDHGTASTDALAGRLGGLARQLEATDDPSTMLDELVAAAVAIIPGVEHASLSMVQRRREVRSDYPSSELPARVDAIQNEVGEGPCLDAIYEEQTVRVPDMLHEPRWPRFAKRAHDAGAGSMLSFQLYVQDDNLGSLNLYNTRANGFDDESEQVGLLFASHAAVAYADSKKISSMGRALASRDLIGQAKGMLMERYHLDADRAFGVLTRVSQATHRPLREIAEELATTGRLTALEPDRGGGE
ncbi:GAF domain-containing protein [Microlunatus sagamiharensis]|uniref:GAF domain-containing protein n=1 Tax=Microlunatus sagamiharensis TaxID=546874 RepID=A0A1H2MFP0_9ACTN|nr:GAF and ANTAR domain-containing protein [Microlunatus sagamiharensis]SDU91865.1 GAF domain-containing protein [Microlunatus sagamiharensis]